MALTERAEAAITRALDRPARLQVEDVPLAEALDLLYQGSQVPISFSPSLLPEGRKVTCICRELTVAEALERILAGTAFRYREIEGHVLVYSTRLPGIELDPRLLSPRRWYASNGLAPSISLATAARDPIIMLSQTGTIVGSVIDRRTRAPLASVQVHLAALAIGTITDGRGRFLLPNVPAGTHDIRAEVLGYRAETVQLTVRSEQTTSVTFELTAEAIALDEVVVTGTAGGVESRAIGNVVEMVPVVEVLERRSPTSMQDFLVAEVPGLRIRSQGGEIGAGFRMQIRGTGSMTLGGAPIVYVDGVRVDSRENAPAANRQERTPPSRLSDLPLNDIERIEVIKGPAAATLYGTEASNGVIQIFTKKGTEGRPRIDVKITQGANFLHNPEDVFPVVYGTDPTTGELLSLNLVTSENERGSPIFQTGHSQSLFASISGSTEGVKYHLSGELGRDEGLVSYHWQEKVRARSNISYTTGAFDVGVNLGVIHQVTNNEGSQQPITGQILYGSPLKLGSASRGFNNNPPEEWKSLEGGETANRIIGGLHIKHTPRDWFIHRVTVGADVGSTRSFSLWPRATEQPGPFAGNSLGRKDVLQDQLTLITVDYSASVPLQLTPSLSSETSGGFQYYESQNEIVRASGREFPVPGLETISSTAVRFSEEDFLENKTVGVYLQERLGWKDRIFLTGAIRGDDNSAFGENYSFVSYPKASFSWVISEEPFWDVPFVNTLRLRSAWGTAGQQPDIFAATQLYAPTTGPGGTPALTRANIGNADLKPEVGEEIEVGLDAAFFDQRIGLEATYYRQIRKDAIVARAALPSLGFPGIEFVNLGKIRNKGIELGLSADLIRSADWSWDAGAIFSTTDNVIEDLGGITPPSFGAPWPGQRHVEGYPIGSLFMKKVVSAEWDENNNLVNVMCEGGDPITGGGPPVPCEEAGTAYFGQPTPTWDFGATTSLRYSNLILSATVDGQGGYVKCDTRMGWPHVFFRNTREINLPPPQRDPILAAYDQLGEGVCQTGLVDAGYSKLRDLSLRFNLPTSWAERFRASTASVTLAGHNLATLWLAEREKFGHKVVDPETHATSERPSYANMNDAAHGMTAYIQDQWPTFQRIVLSLSASF
ncbi:MAG: TonB-dependent receptor domain-containing protein [Longimicrobiales bacterium]